MLARLHDPIWVLLSIAAVALLLRCVAWIQRRRPLSPFLFRKLLHGIIGVMTLAMTTVFHSRWWAMLPPALFAVLNASPKVRETIPDLGDDPQELRGLWMFPFGVCLVYLLFWGFGHRGAVLAGIAALSFGDPAAALVGSRWGQRRYARLGHGRSVEGSLAFLIVAGIAVGVIAAACPGGPPPVRAAVGCGVAGAIAEALSPADADNFTVPIVVAAAYQLLA